MSILDRFRAALPHSAPEIVVELRNQFNEARVAAEPRISRYAEYEAEYRKARSNEAVTEWDYGKHVDVSRRERHSIPLPYVHAITQKHTYRIAQRLPDIIVPRLDSDEAETHRADTMEKVLYATYGYNQAASQFASAAHHNSLLGASCFDLYWSTSRQQVRFRELHPGSILVVPGVDDIHDFEMVFRFWTVSRASFRAKYGGKELPFGGDAMRVDDDAGHEGCITIIQASDRMRTVRFAGNLVLEMDAHDMGFVPYVLTKNLGPNEEMFGYSDYEFFRHVAAYFETLFSRQADVMEGTAGGAMQDFGSGQKADVVVRTMREGGLIPVRKDSKGIAPIDTPQFGAWIDQHAQYARTALNDLGFSPPAVWGDLGSASAADRALQIAPQVELTGLKQIHFGASLTRLNERIFRMIEAKQALPRTLRGTHVRGFRSTAFSIVLGAAVKASMQPQTDDSIAQGDVPANPIALFDGDYCTEIVWQNRLEREDPQFVLTELNKFDRGVQSLYTTLERLGWPDPEAEIKLIEQEAERLPWLRSGMIALIKQQLDAKASSGSDPAAGGSPDISASIASMGGAGGGMGGALTTDALGSALNGSSNRGDKPQGALPGAYSGAA